MRLDDIELVGAWRIVREQQIVLVRHQRRHQRRGRADEQLELHAGIALLIARDGFRDQVVGRGFRARDPHRAAHQAAQLLDLRDGGGEIGQAAPDGRDQDLAGRGQAHAARQPLEQRRAKLLLDIQDAAIERGRCDAQPIGGFADRARARDGVENEIEAGRLEHAGEIRADQAERNQSAHPPRKARRPRRSTTTADWISRLRGE